MKIDIPKIRKTIHLSEYAPDMGKQQVTVWVNPPRKVLDRFPELYEQLQRGQFGADDMMEFAEMIGALWESSADEVKALIESSFDTDPMFFEWLVVKTFDEIMDHRGAQKKNWKMKHFTLREPD